MSKTEGKDAEQRPAVEGFDFVFGAFGEVVPITKEQTQETIGWQPTRRAYGHMV